MDETTPNASEFYAALSKAQAEMKPAEKDGENPHLGKPYATLKSVWDACREPLTKYGFCVIQEPVEAPAGFVRVRTTLGHSSGVARVSEAQMPVAKPDPQSYGSVLTYLRRYTLSSVVGVCPDDDDDAIAGKPEQRPAGNQQRRQDPPRQNTPAPRSQETSRSAEQHQSYGAATGAPPSEAPRQPAPASPAPAASNGSEAYACKEEGCGKSLTKGQHDISLRAYGTPLCPEHQKTHQRAAA